MKRKISYAVFPALVAAPAVHADFISDSKGSLQIRNYYFDNDYHGSPGVNEAREWAQGFIFKAESGYTGGTLGVGLNVIGMAGFKLDSSPDRTGTGVLSYNPATREVHDNYSKAGVAAKFKVSKTELQAGYMSPLLPVIFPVTTRLFPPLFRGAYLTSSEIEKLTLHAGYFDRQKYRDSTEDGKLRVGAPNGRFISTAESDGFSLAGADYKWTPELSTSYFYAELQDIYQQHYLNVTHSLPVGPGALKNEIYYFASTKAGAARAGAVDNGTLNLNASYRLLSNTFSLGYMHLHGDTGMPYLAGTDPNVLVGGALTTEFLNPKERVWQFKHMYDFASLGLPGLKSEVRYIRGSNIDLPVTDGSGHESERYLELSYVIQSGSLSGVGLRVRQGKYQNDFSRDIEQFRVNIDYTLALW